MKQLDHVFADPEVRSSKITPTFTGTVVLLEVNDQETEKNNIVRASLLRSEK